MYKRQALARTPQHEPLPPEGVARAGGDWVYAEYAEQEHVPEAADGFETLIGTLSSSGEEPPR